jgi:hypothetical protein
MDTMRGLERLRPWLFWILLLGFSGTEIELLLLKHWEEPLQLAPLVLIALAAVVLIWNSATRTSTSRRTLQTMMGLLVVAGLLGVVLHFRGAVEFQLEINPQMARGELIKKAVQAQAPPFLAPGVMLQMGLIGLAYSLANSGGKEKELTR